ncbi:MAG: iron-sulfur cluster assembly accessory protein [Deltaproteobacteria bacterium]|nr:iron-sulfur cluster assembly accessory protein [Deltaproteobacteria bacterium]
MRHAPVDNSRVIPTIVHLTDAAAAALRRYLDDVSPDDAPLRVAIEGDPVHGYSYFFGYSDDPSNPYELDEQVDIIQRSKGFPVAIRREHAPYLLGATIDYDESRCAFRFDNPNVAGVI